MATENLATPERFSASAIYEAYEDGSSWLGSRDEFVRAGKYDQLLELYRELKWRMDGLEK